MSALSAKIKAAETISEFYRAYKSIKQDWKNSIQQLNKFKNRCDDMIMRINNDASMDAEAKAELVNGITTDILTPIGNYLAVTGTDKIIDKDFMML